jgi:hypothetical protein
VSPISRPTCPEPRRASTLDIADANQEVAVSETATVLQHDTIAKLFAHYTAKLAPWYDLNDPARVFTLKVPDAALRAPLLFKAIIAFSACHWCKVHGEHGVIATAFHDACVTDFLQSMEAVSVESRDLNLAATCLLRSYELISGTHQAFEGLHELTSGRQSGDRESFAWRVLVRLE